MKTVSDIPLRVISDRHQSIVRERRRQRNLLVLTQPEGQLSAACPTQELLDESQVRGHAMEIPPIPPKLPPNGLPASTPT